MNDGLTSSRLNARNSHCEAAFQAELRPRSAGLRRTLRALLAMTVFGVVATIQDLSFSEEIPQRLDGRVVRIDSERRILSLGFEYPATAEYAEKDFYVAEDAGFKDFKRLSELQEGDLVSLDYLDYQPMAKAIYVIHIPVEKVYFTRKDIAEAFIKIKSGQKDEHVQEA